MTKQLAVAILLLVHLFYLVSLTSTFECKHDQLEKHDENGTFQGCLDCRTCQLGEGHYPRCGEGNVRQASDIKCVQCINGTTYSEHVGIASCQSCNSCLGRKEITPCTLKHRAVCSTECQPGYILNSGLGLCILAPTTPAPSTKSTESGPVPRTTEEAVSVKNINEQDDSKDKGENESPTAAGPQHEESPVMIATLSVVCMAIVALLLAVAIAKRQRIMELCSPTNSNGQEIEEAVQRNPLVGDSSPESSPGSSTDCVIEMTHEEQFSTELLLADLRLCLKEFTGIKLSEKKPGVKGWREVAEQLPKKVSPDSLDSIALQDIPGEKLLTYLEAAQPDLTVMQFIDVLQSVDRNDIVKRLKEDLKQQARKC